MTIEHMFGTMMSMTRPPHVTAALAAELHRVIDELAEASVVCEDASAREVAALGEEIVALQRAVTRAEREIARRLAAFEGSGGHAAHGYRSAATWFAERTGVSRRDAARRVTTAKRLGRCRLVDRAWSEARLSSRAVDELCRVSEDFPAQFADQEAHMVAFAEDHSIDEVVRRCRHLRTSLDPDASEEEANTRHHERRCRAAVSPDGALLGDFTLFGDQAAIVAAALDAGLQLERDHDLALHPDDPTQHRTVAQRRADVMVDMARFYVERLRDVDGASSAVRVRPNVTVVVDLASLAGSPEDGGVCAADRIGSISPETARRMACDAQVSRVITGPDSRPLDVGRSKRTATAAQRRAIEVRDGGCAIAGCDRPPWWCDVHHIQHWESGGSTDLDNLLMLCNEHHHQVHEGGRVLVRGPDDRWRAVRVDQTGVRESEAAGVAA